jgi:hypothetical protein
VKANQPSPSIKTLIARAALFAFLFALGMAGWSHYDGKEFDLIQFVFLFGTSFILWLFPDVYYLRSKKTKKP